MMGSQHVNASRKTDSILKVIRRRNVSVYKFSRICSHHVPVQGADDVPKINRLYICLKRSPLLFFLSLMWFWCLQEFHSFHAHTHTQSCRHYCAVYQNGKRSILKMKGRFIHTIIPPSEKLGHFSPMHRNQTTATAQSEWMWVFIWLEIDCNSI